MSVARGRRCLPNSGGDKSVEPKGTSPRRTGVSRKPTTGTALRHQARRQSHCGASYDVHANASSNASNLSRKRLRMDVPSLKFVIDP